MEANKALVVQEYGKPTVLKELPLPELKEGQMLVEVEGSTINPSDRFFLAGMYAKKPLPVAGGLEAAGKVIKANGEGIQHFVGKRVCFLAVSGGWAKLAIANHQTSFIISEDVPIGCAASGIVNPLTVIGFINTFRSNGSKGGIIHTAAASSLGRMLNKMCITENILLLNIVRREEQAELLKSEGAKHILVTKGNWIEEFKELSKTHGFDCLFDALGGGDVISEIVNNLNPGSKSYTYGILEPKPLIVNPQTVLMKGINILSFMMVPWWSQISPQAQQQIRENYSDYLKKELATTTFKQLPFENIQEGLELSVTKATQGKILLRPS